MTNKNNSAAFRPIVGIDLGTTNSAVAFIHHGKPELISSPGGEAIIPSVVLIDLQGKVIVGEAARAALVAMPDRSLAAVKRKMGSPERISIAGQALLPQEISALILKELKSYADELYGEGEKEAVITVPAYFTDEQRKATKEAGELAGFVVERIINEPTAAALAFGLTHLDEDRHLLVYDLGGGTFDVSIVEMMSGIMEVKASSGDRHLGGEDFDWLLVDWFAERLLEQHQVDPRADIRAKALLKEEAEKVKKRLSSESVVDIALPLVMVKDQQPIGLYAQITREQFVELIDGLLKKTMDSVQQVLTDAGLQPKDIDDVLLVGGSTRIPRVHELVQAQFGKLPRTDVNPDEAVALGAAVQAGLKSGALSDSGLVATDVAPFSMGIAVLREWGASARPGGFAPVIPRNTTIPVTKSQPFYTAAPGQTAVSIEIYQGENEWVKHNHRLGKFLFEGIPINQANQEMIEVTFRYNLNGILEVSCKSTSTGQEMSVTVQDALDRNSKESYQESLAMLNNLWDGAAEEIDEEEEFIEQQEMDFLDELEKAMEMTELPDTTVLQEEGQKLREQAETVLASINAADQRMRLQGLIGLLDNAMQGDDIEEQESAMDQLTDMLIELEL